MAEEKILSPRQALQYLCAELKKRQTAYADGLKELHKKEQLKPEKLGKMQIAEKGPPMSPSIPAPPPPPAPAPSGGGKMMLPGELAKDADDMEMAEKGVKKTDPLSSNVSPKVETVKAGQPQGQKEVKKAPMKKDELAKAAIPPPIPGSPKVKLPGVNEAGLKAKVAASKPPAMPGVLHSNAPSVHLAGVGQPSAKPAQGVQTMAERVASKMPSPAMKAPPKIALPGAKKPAATPPPIPADAKPAQPKAK